MALCFHVAHYCEGMLKNVNLLLRLIRLVQNIVFLSFYGWKNVTYIDCLIF